MLFKICSLKVNLLIFTSIIFCVHCHNLYSFISNNTCGCFLDYYDSLDSCSITHTKCNPNNLKFEAFEPENIANCNQWSLYGYNVTLLNRDEGTILLSLLLPKSKPYELNRKYKVDLNVLDPSEGFNSTQRLSLPNHSSKYVSVLNTTNCQSVVTVEFKYLYSATYKLEVTAGESYSRSMKCLSKSFDISSNYKKRKLNLQPTYLSRYSPQTQELILDSKFGNFSAGHHPDATVVILRSHIDISLRDCAGSGNEVAKYILHGKGGVCCDCFDANDTNGACNGQKLCPCQWKRDGENLECKFRNVTNGDYCVVVQFFDPRCAGDTIWTKDGGCGWSFNETAKGLQSPTTYSILSGRTLHWPIYISILCFIVLVVGSYVLYKRKPKCFKKLNHGIHQYVPTMNQPSDIPVNPWYLPRDDKKLTELLLLYPRDCEPFMNAMAAFRAYLRSNNLTVFDPWDDEIYDDVVESYETWSLQFIKNNNVKIVIVLTELSKNFEDAFLQNSILGYSEPQPRDTIFPQSFSTIHQFFGKRFDSYQRLFVIRFDGSPMTNFEFITPNKLYSIPTNIGVLISDLTSGNLKESNYFKHSKLRDAIAEYESYTNTNNDYLAELLCPKKINVS